MVYEIIVYCFIPTTNENNKYETDKKYVNFFQSITKQIVVVWPGSTKEDEIWLKSNDSSSWHFTEI